MQVRELAETVNVFAGSWDELSVVFVNRNHTSAANFAGRNVANSSSRKVFDWPVF